MMQRAIAEALGAAPGEAQQVAPLVQITTSGDRIQDRRLMEIGGKGLFNKEIEEALLDGRIHRAIHSLKDMPAQLPPGLAIPAIPRRVDSKGSVLSDTFNPLHEIPPCSRPGTAPP